MFLLVAIFIVVPIAELYVIIKVGGAIGVGPTIALLLIDSLIGAWLLRHQGRASWVAFNRAMAENRVPAREVFDGALVIFGGALLLTPGFITDVLGLALLIPPSRAIVRGISARLALGRFGWGARAAHWSYGRVRRRAGTRGGGAAAGGGAGAAGPGAAGAAAGGATAGSWGGFPPPRADRTGPRPDDIEGTAEDVTEREPPPEIPGPGR